MSNIELPPSTFEATSQFTNPVIGAIKNMVG
jgi:hypothetical protein